MSLTVPHNADGGPGGLAYGIQQLRDRTRVLCAAVEDAMRANVLQNTGPLASIRPIPTVSREIADTFLQFLGGEIQAEKLSSWVAELVRQGLGPRSALAITSSLRAASLQVVEADLESAQLLHSPGEDLRPVIEAFSSQFFLSYTRAREDKILVDQERLYRNLNVTIRKQQADLQRRQSQLQTAAEVARAASSVLDPDELMQRVVNLVLGRLDLYYAGLFLVDQTGEWTGEPGRWAVLRAGTGQAGRQMLAQGHKLEIGVSSMIGSCIAQGKGRVALDVGKEAVRFDNPLLPHTRSELALPLISRGRPIGAMTIQSTRQRAFSEADVTALQVMADQLANAIQNARLFVDAQESVQRVQTLYETSRVLSSSLEEEALMRAILEGISQRMGCEYAIVFVVDEKTKTIEGRHGLWRGEYDVFPQWIELSKYPLDHPDILSDVYRTCRTEIIAGWDDRFNREIYERFGHERLLRIFMPIQLRDRVTGVIEVAYDRNEKGRVDEKEVQLLGAFVDQAAVALENARLFAQTQARTEELIVLNEVSQSLAARLSVDEILNDVHRGASLLLDAANFYVALYDPERHEVTFPFDTTTEEADRFLSLPADQGITGYIIRNRTSVLVEESVSERLQEMGIEMVGSPALSWLGVPMMVGDQVLGVIAVQSFTTPRAYSEHDRDLLNALASQAAIALQNARLFEEVQRREARERLVREVTDRMRSAPDMDALMQTTVREMAAAMGTSGAFLQLSGSMGQGDGENGTDRRHNQVERVKER